LAGPRGRDRTTLPPEVEEEVRSAVEEYLEALELGAEPDREAILAAHPSVVSILEERLEAVDRLHAAVRAGGLSGPTVPGAFQVRCPHCAHAIASVEPLGGLVTCEGCGSSFRIEAGPEEGMGGELPDSFGRFQLLEILGRGAFGVVYKALDTELDRVVALKVPRAGIFSTDEDEERFHREARSAAALKHRGIVQVYEILEVDGLPCIVSEYIEGRTLARVIEEGRLSFKESAQLVREVGEALEYAHGHQVIHRDVKPGNILIDASGRPYITDFGLARRDEGEVTVTLDGQVLGTPAYMSPEQARGDREEVDGRSDVYGLGTVLYELLAGERPYSGNRSMVLHQLLNDEPRSPRRLNEHVPRDLETVCLKAMAKERARRYATAGEFADDLGRYLRGEPVRARPVGPVEKLWRWCRRKPVLAVLSAAVLVLVVAVVVGSIAAAFRFERDAEAEKDLRIQKEKALDRAKGQQLLTLSSTVLAANPAQALLLAIDGAIREPGLVATNSILAALGDIREVRTFLGHDFYLTSAEFSPDGAQVVTSSFDTSVRMWDAQSGELTRLFSGHTVQVNSVRFSPDGKRVISACWDLTARILDAGSGKQLFVLGDHRNVVDHAVFSPDGLLALTASRDGHARIWDARTGRLRVRLRHAGWVPFAAFSPDSGRVVTASHDGTAGVWNVEGKLLFRLEGNGLWMTYALFSPDGRLIATASIDGKAGVWDASTGRGISTLEGHRGGINTVDFDEAGRRVLTSSADGTARIWDTITGEELSRLSGHEDWVTVAKFSPDGSMALTASRDRTARIWDAETGRELVALLGHSDHVVSAVFSRDGRKVLTASWDATARTWEAPSKDDLTAARRRRDWGGATSSSSDGSKVVVYDRGPTADIFETATGKLLAELKGHEGWIAHARFSPDDRRIVTTSFDNTARIWDAATGAKQVDLKGHTYWVESASFSSDGERVVTSSRDFTAKVWDSRTGALIKDLGRHIGWVYAAYFSPDGKRILTLSDNITRVWDTSTWKVRHELVHQAPVKSAGIHPERPLALTTTGGGEIKIYLWDLTKGERLALLEGHEGKFTSASFSGDGRYLATVFQDRSVRVWKLPAGELMAVVRSKDCDFLAASFSADCQVLHTTGIDGRKRLWPLDALKAAVARKPRDLTPIEINRLEIWTPAEREEYTRTWKLSELAEERSVSEAVWCREPSNPILRDQYLQLLRRQLETTIADPGLDRLGIPLEVCRLAVEKSGGRDLGWLMQLAAWQSRAGAHLDALRTLESASRLFVLRDFGPLISAFRKKLHPDLPTYGSIDAALAAADRKTLIALGERWRYFRGRSEPSPALEWTTADFDDSTWEQGQSAFGYGPSDLKTQLPDMNGSYTTFYIRREFTAPPEEIHRLILAVRADDGCVAYLNGSEFGRVGAGQPGERLAHDATADPNTPELLAPHELAVPLERLLPGSNVLAIQGLNQTPASSDFSLYPELYCDLNPRDEQDRKLVAGLRVVAKGLDAPARLAYARGRSLQRAGRHMAALAEFERASSIDPSRPEPVERLVESLVALGRAEEAESRLRRFLDSRVGTEIGSDEGTWDLWWRLSVVDLRRNAAEVRAALPAAASGQPAEGAGRRGELLWVLDRLIVGDPLRINAGGADERGAGGEVWGGDRFHLGGTSIAGDPEGPAAPGIFGLTRGEAAEAIHRTARSFDKGTLRWPGYRIPVVPGRYGVTLHFVGHPTDPNQQQVFDVLLERKTVLERFEPGGLTRIAAKLLPKGAVPPATVEKKRMEVEVGDGFLDVELAHYTLTAAIAAIEVESLR